MSHSASRLWTSYCEECADPLAELHLQGAEQVTLRITSWDQRSQYERLTGEVLPVLHDRLGT